MGFSDRGLCRRRIVRRVIWAIDDEAHDGAGHDHGRDQSKDPEGTPSVLNSWRIHSAEGSDGGPPIDIVTGALDALPFH